MLSVIISSHKPDYLNALAKNIEETAGVPFEIISISNPGIMGICEAYNKGIDKAKYNILCFAHEDILFTTNNWGQTIINLLTNKNIGLLGVAGTKYKTLAPSSWSFARQSQYINIIQQFKFSKKEPFKHYENPAQSSLASVACVDGVLMFTTKEITSKIRFDQDTFRSFHFYDSDFSMQVLSQYTVAVTFDIEIEHFSEGKHDKQWLKDCLSFYQKWKQTLPVNLDNTPQSEARKHELFAAKEFVNRMKENGYSLQKRLKLLSDLFASGKVNKLSFIKLMIKVIMSSLKSSN